MYTYIYRCICAWRIHSPIYLCIWSDDSSIRKRSAIPADLLGSKPPKKAATNHATVPWRCDGQASWRPWWGVASIVLVSQS